MTSVEAFAFVGPAVEQAVALVMWKFWWYVEHDRDAIKEDLTSLGLELAVSEFLPQYDGPYYGRSFEEYAVGGLRIQLANHVREWRQVLTAPSGARAGMAMHSCRTVDESISVDDDDAPDEGWFDAAEPAVAGALTDEPDAYLLRQLVVEGRTCGDLAAELYGESTASTRGKIARRRDDALARLRFDEDLRDHYAERFGTDGWDLEYAHDVDAECVGAIAGWCQAVVALDAYAALGAWVVAVAGGEVAPGFTDEAPRVAVASVEREQGASPFSPGEGASSSIGLPAPKPDGGRAPRRTDLYVVAPPAGPARATPPTSQCEAGDSSQPALSTRVAQWQGSGAAPERWHIPVRFRARVPLPPLLAGHPRASPGVLRMAA